MQVARKHQLSLRLRDIGARSNATGVAMERTIAAVPATNIALRSMISIFLLIGRRGETRRPSSAPGQCERGADVLIGGATQRELQWWVIRVGGLDDRIDGVGGVTADLERTVDDETANFACG